MQIIDREATLPFIRVPPLDRFAHSDEEKRKLQTIIRELKCGQMLALATDLIGTLSMFQEYDSETSKKLLKLTILDWSLSQQELSEIFNLNLLKKEEDHQLKVALKEFVKPEELNDAYTLIYTIRHKYFLDKSDIVRNNNRAFPEKNSERYLNMGYRRIAIFLRAEYTSTSSENKALLEKFYPQELLKNKVSRRDANLDLSLTLYEIQALIIQAVQLQINTNQCPKDNLRPTTLADKLLANYQAFTHEPAFAILYVGHLLEQARANPNFEVDAVDRHTGRSLLMEALRLQNNEAVRFLLLNKVKVTGTDRTGYTPLHFAVENKESAIFLQVLANTNNVNAQDEGGYTPIYLAAEANQADRVSALLAAGADPNLANNRYKSTALHIAVRNDSLAAVRALLESGKVDLTAQNKDGMTARMLAKDSCIPIFNAKIVQPITTNPTPLKMPSASPTIPATPSKPTAVLINLNNPANLVSFKHMLQSPRKHREHLTAFSKSIQEINNPFTIHFFKADQHQLEEMNSFANRLKCEDDNNKKIASEFSLLISKLKTLGTEKNNFAKAYSLINKIANQTIELGISSFALAFELVKYNLIDYYILLVEDKSPVQVAIVHEDIALLEELLVESPNREDVTIKFEDESYSEFNYAIFMGRVNVVKAMLLIASNHPEIGLGEISKDAIELTEKRLQEINDINPAFQEVKENFDAIVPKASRDNWKRLLRDLQRTLPKETLNPVNGFFTPKEYNLVLALIAEKKPSLWQSLRNAYTRLVLARKYLRQYQMMLQGQEVAAMPNGLYRPAQIENIDLSLLQSEIDRKYNNSILQELTKNVSRWHHATRPPINTANIENILRHATSNEAHILQTKKIMTVAEAVKTVGIKSGTPAKMQHNIYFSLAGVTPFRQKATHILEMKILKAIKNKKITNDKIYTSAHLAAFTINRTETPIFFRGNDAKKLTIYRVYHVTNQKTNEKYKIHWYDYIQDGIVIGNYYEKVALKGEFFQGNNVSTTAYRFVHFLRCLKGNFTEGSYYHYLLENLDNAQIINSAKEALFNVLNVEVKVTETIDFDNDSMKMLKNEKADHYLELAPDHKQSITELIVQDKLDELKKLISTFSIYKEQLGFALVAAVQATNSNMVEYLLTLGVSIADDNNKALFTLLQNIKPHYTVPIPNENDPELVEKKKILNQFLFSGTANDFDPNHIRYGAAIENCVPSTGSWTSTVDKNLSFSQDLLFQFDHTDMQQPFLDSLSSSLEGLYEFTSNRSLYDSHEYIAKRLNLPSKITQKNYANNMIQKVERGDIEGLRNEPNMILLHAGRYAVLTDKIEVLKALPNINKLFSPWKLLFYALRLKKLEAIKFLVDLINLEKAEESLEMLLTAISQINDDDLTKKILTTKIENTDVLLLKAIQQSNFARVKLLTQYLDLESLEKPYLQGLAHHLPKDRSWDDFPMAIGKLLAETLFFGDHQIIRLIFTKVIVHTNNNVDDVQYLHILSLIMIHAAENCAPPLVSLLIELLKNGLKKTSIDEREVLYPVFQIKGGLSNIPEKPKPKVKRIKKNVSALQEKNKPKKVPWLYWHNIDKLVEVARLENLNLIFDYLNILYEATPNAVWEREPKDNFLHLVIRKNNVDKYHLIKKIFPQLKLITERYTAAGLYATAISNSNDDITFLKILLLEGIELPTDLTEKVSLLIQAVKKGYTKVIQWLFEEVKLLQKDTVGPATNRNLFQLMKLHIDSTQDGLNYSYQSRDKIWKALHYLCNDIGVNINHLDAINKHLMFYPSLGFWERFILSNEHTDCSLRDEHGNTLLHVTQDADEKDIDLFIKKGGNIHAVNNEGVSVYERFFKLAQSVICAKLKSYHCVLRKGLPLFSQTHIMMTLMVGTDLYLVMNLQGLCVFGQDVVSTSQFKKAKLFVKQHPPSFLSIRHLDKGVHQVMPNLSLKQLFNLGDSLRLVKIPAEAISSVADNYQFDHLDETITLSKMVRLLLSAIIKGDYNLSDDVFDQAKTLFEDTETRLMQAYRPILEGDLKNLTQNFPSLRLAYQDPNIQMACDMLIPNELPPNLCYTPTVFYSPIIAAVCSGHPGILEFLIDQGITYPENGSSKKSPLEEAFIRNDFAMAIVLLKKRAVTLSFQSLLALSSKRHNLPNNLIGTYVDALIEYAATIPLPFTSKKEQQCSKELIDALNATLDDKNQFADLLVKLEKLKLTLGQNKKSSKPKRLKANKIEEDSSEEERPPKKLRLSEQQGTFFSAKRKRQNEEREPKSESLSSESYEEKGP